MQNERINMTEYFFIIFPSNKLFLNNLKRKLSVKDMCESSSQILLAANVHILSFCVIYFCRLGSFQLSFSSHSKSLYKP